MSQPKYKRVLLKISGEALSREERFGIDSNVLKEIARQIIEVKETGTEIAMVVGGGNIWRGNAAEAKGMDRSTA
ncbi:MAG: UMP kinase, partial [Dehalococcoidia bacterium]